LQLVLRLLGRLNHDPSVLIQLHELLLGRPLTLNLGLEDRLELGEAALNVIFLEREAVGRSRRRGKEE
jgi:hypothetical protein